MARQIGDLINYTGSMFGFYWVPDKARGRINDKEVKEMVFTEERVCYRFNIKEGKSGLIPLKNNGLIQIVKKKGDKYHVIPETIFDTTNLPEVWIK